MSYDDDDTIIETSRGYLVLGVVSTIIGAFGYLLLVFSFFVGWTLLRSGDTTADRLLAGLGGFFGTVLLGLSAVAFAELLSLARDLERNSRRAYELLEELLAG